MQRRLRVIALISGSVKPAQAVPLAEIAAPATTAFGAAGYVTAGFIGVVGVICVYDLLLKINGLKNWDGTSKKGVKLPF